MTELDFFRGLILVEPYGKYISNSTKNIIIKSKKIETITKKKLLLIENKLGLGIIILGEIIKIDLDQFAKLKKYHRIPESDRIKWWSGYRYLYAYSIIFTQSYRLPLLLNYPTGPQITVRPENISISKVFVGTSGYHYSQMYPKNTKFMLDYYSKYLNSVEINYTFYRQPSKQSILNLGKYDLMYSIKVHKYITHNKKLRRIKTFWEKFYRSFHPIHHKIICFLFQFSPKFYLNQENFNRIKKISKILNKQHSYAFEFRERKWMNDENVNNLFRQNQWILVISNVTNIDNWAGDLNDGFNPSLSKYHFTSNYVYFRMHGSVDQCIGLL